jgi:hypothetical protein
MSSAGASALSGGLTATTCTTVIFGEALVDDFHHEQVVGGAPH